jgi:hypothetical protein
MLITTTKHLVKDRRHHGKLKEKKIPSLSPNAQFKIAKLPKIRKASIRFAQFKIAELQD